MSYEIVKKTVKFGLYDVNDVNQEPYNWQYDSSFSRQ